MSELYGESIQSQRRLTFLNLGAFTANTTVTAAPRFGAPLGITAIRIIGIHLCSDGVPSDADGTLVFNAIVNDISEGGDDTIVSAEDLETLIAAANRWYECTLAAEDTEKQLTINPRDSVRFTLVSDSAAIDTNPDLTVCIEWHPVPDPTNHDRIKHATEYNV
jgi:hypothetical protein